LISQRKLLCLGIEFHVSRPITTAFILDESAVDVVMYLKCLKSLDIAGKTNRNN
jgi:hypothetical protein